MVAPKPRPRAHQILDEGHIQGDMKFSGAGCSGDSETHVESPSVFHAACLTDDEVAPKRKGWLGRFVCLPKFRLRKRKGGKKSIGFSEEVPRPPPMDVESSYMPSIFDPPRTPVTPLRRGRGRLESGRSRLESGISDTGYQVPPILKDSQLQELWTWLPARERIKNARIVYCMGRHGRSLKTLYRKAQQVWNCRPSVSPQFCLLGFVSVFHWSVVSSFRRKVACTRHACMLVLIANMVLAYRHGTARVPSVDASPLPNASSS